MKDAQSIGFFNRDVFLFGRNESFLRKFGGQRLNLIRFYVIPKRRGVNYHIKKI